MKKVDKKSPFGMFEFDMLWMSINYAIGRKTAACLDLPRQILENLYRLSEHQKSRLYSFYKKFKTEDELIDKSWGIFFSFLDTENRYKIDIEGASLVAFRHKTKYYFLSDYEDNSCCLSEVLVNNNKKETKITKIKKETSNV